MQVPAPQDTDPERVVAAAQKLAAQAEFAKARGLLNWLLAHEPERRDARLGLARTDAWEHCYARAEASYRTLLEEKPEDAEARSGLIDVLLWQNRRSEAEVEADRGLVLAPNSPELWQRRAVLYLRADEPEPALAAANKALWLAPNDPELRVLRDRIFLSQIRAWIRFDYFARDYPNLYSAGVQGWHRFGRFELTADVLVQDRMGGSQPRAIIDAIYVAGASYHAGPLATAGVNLGLGLPAKTLPRWLGRAWFTSQFLPAWGATLAYSLWDYSDKTAHIVAPVLSFTPTDRWFFDLRAWITWLVIRGGGPDSVDVVPTAGIRVAYQLLTSLRLGGSYAYGPQLDRAGLDRFAQVKSHVFNVFADYRPVRGWGLQPLLGFEHRTTANTQLFVLTVELATYIRW